MTALEPNSTPGLLGLLIAGVRAEFRSDALEFASDDAVFGGGSCRVTDCGRSARGHGLCQGHHQRWANAGRPPDLEEFTASTDPRCANIAPPTRHVGSTAAVTGRLAADCVSCTRNGGNAPGGRPLTSWLRDPLPVKQPRPGATCQIGHCSLWPQAKSPLCHSHTNTWKANDRNDIDEFVARFESNDTPANETIQLGMLTPQLKLEMQYVLQQRHDDRRGKLTPAVVARVVRLLIDTATTSLLDFDADQWRQRSAVLLNDTRSRGLLLYAHLTMLDLAEAGGWEAEYPRDVWRMHRLGYEGHYTLRFDRIPQPWLREPAKRWIRLRLSRGLNLEAGGGRPLLAIARFGRFLADVDIDDISRIDRELLERYLAHLNQEYSPQRRGAHIGLLNGFFAAIRQHCWATGLPDTAMFFAEDHPKRGEHLPRALAEHVMTQLEHHDNLDQFNNPAYRLITVILMRCGLRITDALRLRGDCVTTDADGGTLSALLQPQDEAGRPCSDRPPRPRRHDRPPTPTRLRTLARRHWTAVPAPPTKNIDGQVPPWGSRPTARRCTDGSQPATSATSTTGGCI